MNLENLFAWVISVIIGFAVVGKLDVIEKWVHHAEARLLDESKTSNWGSPVFFPDRKL